ncbi:MAG: polysulfide reductase NrfD [Acidobacteriaceae bacterium]|nr:polysulfide reductase NrfD [Acidobacteriaceae bacterium]
MIARYRKSVEPVYTDGRDIDREVGSLMGEAAQQLSSGSSDPHIAEIARRWTQLPEPRAGDPTYYDRALLQESVWTWAIPTYYFIGGLSGASMALGAALELRRDPSVDELIQRCHLIGFIGTTVSGVLLIYDLGRPWRFLAMLRVFRPTSPMNMGAWVLSITGGTAAAAVVLRRAPGFIRRIGETLGIISGISGLALATYTGVLIANTAVPLWQAGRKVLPLLFGASAVASVGSVLDLLCENDEQRHITAIYGNVGRLGELAASYAFERQVSVVPAVGRPLKRGLPGVMWRAASLLTASSVAVSVFSRQRTRTSQLTAGALGALGSFLMRFAVEHAGNASARDPRASFHQQRAGLGAAEVTGKTPRVP